MPHIPPSLRCLALAALFLLLAPSARAGAVFEIREDVKINGADFNFNFGDGNGQTTTIAGVGSIKRSGGIGAGAIFKTSAIPLAIFTINRCCAVAPHVHPNSAETLFVIQGSIRIYQFRGEEAINNVTVTNVATGSAAYIQQGAYHMVENTSAGTTKFLQIFDHPQGGAVFAAPALAALHNFGVGSNNNAEKIVDASFSSPIFPDGGTLVTGKPPLVNFGTCNW